MPAPDQTTRFIARFVAHVTTRPFLDDLARLHRTRRPEPARLDAPADDQDDRQAA